MAGIGALAVGLFDAIGAGGLAGAADFIGGGIAGGVSGLLGAGGLGLDAGLAAGIGTGLGDVLGAGAVGAALGAGTGAAEAALTGGNVGKGALKGAEFGGLGGGVLGGFSALTGDVAAASGFANAGGGIGVNPTPALVSAGAPGGGGPIGGATAAAAPGSVPIGGPGQDITASLGADPNAGFQGLYQDPVTGASVGGTTGQASTTGGVGGITAGTAPSEDFSLSVTNAGGAPSFTGTPTSVGPGPSVTAYTGDAAPSLPAPVATAGTTPVSDAIAPENASAFAAQDTAAGTPKGNLFSDPIGTITGAAGSVLGNPATLLTAGVLGLDALKSSKQPLGTKPLVGLAAQDSLQSQQLQSYLYSGTLPPGQQANLNAAEQSAEATIRSNYAARGMSGSTSEYQDLATAKMNEETKGAQIAQSLFSQGIQEAQLASGIYQSLITQSTQSDASLNQAIANLSRSLALGSAQPTQTGA